MDPVLFHGSLPFITDSPAVSRGGRGMLDSFRARLLCTGDWEADAADLGFEIDKKLSSYHSLWVRSMEPTNETDDVVIVDIVGEGLSNEGERRQRKMKSGEQEVSVGPYEKVIIIYVKDETGTDPEDDSTLDQVPRRTPKLDEDGEPVLKDITTPSGTGKRWLISESEVTLIDTYFVTERPDMSVIGQAFSPVNPPDTPDFLWSGYDQPLRGRHPSGWVLSDRDADEIFYFTDAVGLWRVTDTIVFRQAAIPD